MRGQEQPECEIVDDQRLYCMVFDVRISCVLSAEELRKEEAAEVKIALL